MLEPLHHLQHEIAEALQGANGVGLLALFALSLVFGALHSLLPGHGKMVLAAHHATAGRERLRWTRASLDSVVIAFARVSMAALVVLGAAEAARLYFGEEEAEAHGHGGWAQVVGGLVFVALGVWLFVTARNHDHAPERIRGDVAHRLPLLAMGLVPDPVAAAVLAYAAVANAAAAGVVAALGIALGMAATLLVFALAGPVLADRLLRGLDTEARHRFDHRLRLAGGVVVALIGVSLLLGA